VQDGKLFMYANTQILEITKKAAAAQADMELLQESYRQAKKQQKYYEKQKS